MRFWGLASAALIAIGSFGPWATVGIISRGALDGDALITLGLAILAFALALFDRLPVVALVAGLAVVGIAEIDGQDITQREIFDVAFQRGWGILMVEAAGASLALWGLVSTVDSTGRRTTKTPPTAKG